MHRRKLVQSASIAAALGITNAVSSQPSAFARADLIIHTVHHELTQTPPLLVYSGLATTYQMDPVLTEAAGRSPAVEVWNDWNDTDLQHVFGAFTVGTPDVSLGTYRIFDTPDIAHSVHQPYVEEHEQGYIGVGGVRASRFEGVRESRTEDDRLIIGSLRIWNVIISGFGLDDRTTSDVVMGLVRQLGRSIGALKD